MASIVPVALAVAVAAAVRGYSARFRSKRCGDRGGDHCIYPARPSSEITPMEYTRLWTG